MFFITKHTRTKVRRLKTDEHKKQETMPTITLMSKSNEEIGETPKYQQMWQRLSVREKQEGSWQSKGLGSICADAIVETDMR
jgi:hypothetical protein